MNPSASPVPPAPPSTRLDSIDVVRGLVMVLMALDHARAFFHASAIRGLDPLDPAGTNPALFFTRGITHFCAPVFLLLAGVGARLSLDRGRTPQGLSWFLFTRGVWLIVLEMTWVQWAGWAFAINPLRHHAMVLWAIGWSMIVLAGFIRLPVSAVAGVGLTLIAGHNVFDGIKPEDLGAFGPLWRVLHVGGRVELGGGHYLAAGYPLIPWIGVMAAGYGLGGWYRLESGERRRRLVRLGGAAIAGFLLLRGSGLYGDPRAWNSAAGGWKAVYSFFDCQKYPPSLCYLLMTLGPALLLLAGWDRAQPAWTRPLGVFGRVPMFFYFLHLPLVHGMAVGVAFVRGQGVEWLLYGATPTPPPEGAGLGLPGAYVAWLVVVALLLPVCAWFAEYKRRHRGAWLSYF